MRVSSVTDFTAAVILFVSSSKSAGNGGTLTRSFTYSHKKKSHGVMYGDLGGQECSAKSLGPVRQSINATFSITTGVVCLGASSGI